MIADFSNTDARISITLDFKTGKGNKTQLGIFKHGRLFSSDGREVVGSRNDEQMVRFSASFRTNLQ